MQCSLKLELVSHISYNHLFLRFINNVEIPIKGLKTKNPIFMFK